MQEILTFAVVALAVGFLLRRFFRQYVAAPVSAWLLRRGKLRWALKVRDQAEASGCGNCACGPGKTLDQAPNPISSSKS